MSNGEVWTNQQWRDALSRISDPRTPKSQRMDGCMEVLNQRDLLAGSLAREQATAARLRTRADALVERLARVRRLLIDGASDAGILTVDGQQDAAYQRVREALSDALAKELSTPDVDRAYYALAATTPAPAAQEETR